MNYDLINPSDAVTFTAPSLPVAFLATCLISTSYAATPLDEEGQPLEPEAAKDWEVPMFLFGGAREWAAERWPDLVTATRDEWAEPLLQAHKPELIACLRTFCTGSWKDRKLFDSALAAIDDPEKRAAFLADWDDKKRSSLTEITNRAHRIADRLEASFREAA